MMKERRYQGKHDSSSRAIKRGMISSQEIKRSNNRVIKKDGFLLKQPGQTQPNKGGKIG